VVSQLLWLLILTGVHSKLPLIVNVSSVKFVGVFGAVADVLESTGGRLTGQ
jgi:hypothetical protein